MQPKPARSPVGVAQHPDLHSYRLGNLHAEALPLPEQDAHLAPVLQDEFQPGNAVSKTGMLQKNSSQCKQTTLPYVCVKKVKRKMNVGCGNRNSLVTHHARKLSRPTLKRSRGAGPRSWAQVEYGKPCVSSDETRSPVFVK